MSSLLRSSRLVLMAVFFACIPRVFAQAPVITAISAPRQVVTKGQSLTLSVTATGATSYQWKRSGRSITGATAASYTISSASPIVDNGWYQAVATNGSGSTTSAVVFVVVAPTVTQIVAAGSGSPSSAILSAHQDVVSVSAGWLGGTFAVKGDGSVVTLSGSPAPALTNVVKTAANYGGLALKADGTVVGWDYAPVPAGLSDVVDIALGYIHGIALKANGTVVAWGNNGSGQTNIPFGLSDVVAVTAGYGSSQALKADGTVVAWGSDSVGQGSIPATVTGIVTMSVTHRHGIGVKANGTAVSLTGNIPFPSIFNAVGAAAGYNQSLILRADGTVAGFGLNSAGELNFPADLNSVFAVAAAESDSSFALRDASADLAPTITTQPLSGTVFNGQEVLLNATVAAGTSLLSYQWRKTGANLAGATSPTLTIPRASLSDAGTYDVVITTRLGPVTSQAATLAFNAAAGVITDVTGQQTLSPGGGLTITATAAMAAPVGFQWRRNGVVIPGATGASYAITNASWRDVGAYQVVATGALGRAYGAPIFVNITTPSQVRSWGSDSSGQATVPAGLTNAMAVAAGDAHSMALKSDGSVRTWGSNNVGQLVPPGPLSGVIAIAAGGSSNLALLGDGSIVPWGEINYLPPALIGARVAAISVGTFHSLALRNDGVVISWSIAGTRTDVPTGLSNVVALAAGYEQSLALLADGTVVGWGAASALPAGLTQVKAIAMGRGHGLALKIDGTVVAWGENFGGQATVPAGLAGVVAIAAAGNTSFALKSNGTVAAWGNDAGGVPTDLVSVMALGGGLNHMLVVRDPALDALPVITTPPVAVAANVGQSAVFTVVATGIPPVTSYQWRKGGGILSGASTGETLTLSDVQVSHAGSYDVVVTNAVGSTTSIAATLTVNFAPSITQSPANATVTQGQTATFTAAASGNPAPTYQWQRDTANIPGATNASLTLTGVQPTDAGSYRVVATNSVSSATSSAATLTVQSPPSFTTQPVNTATLAGSSASFTVAASGNPAPTLRWQRQAVGTIGFFDLSSSGTYSGVTSTTLSIFGSTLAMNGDQLRCVATNGIGTPATSNVATLTVNQAPAITSASAVTFPVGVPSVFTVTGTGSPASTFSVGSGSFPSWAALNTTTGAITGTPPHATGSPFTFTLQASNGIGSTASQSFTLTVSFPPVITTPPVDVVVNQGQNATFSVVATAVPAPTYQWRKGGTNLSGATSSTLSLSAVQTASAGSYDVVVTNSLGSATSSAVTLTVNTAPAVATQPVAVTVNQGQTATFSVIATGNPAPTYQWIKNTSQSSLNIAGATNATLTLNNVQASDAAGYQVFLTNSVSTVFSNNATLTVNTPPVISTQPVSKSVNLGASTSLSVVATASPAPTYQWRFGSAPITGATNATLSFSNTQLTSAGDYDVVITNVAGSVTSATATLTVVTMPPSVTTQPVGGTVGVGGGILLSVVASGSPTLTYQWQRNGISLAGGTNASFGIPNAQSWDTGDYVVVVTNPFGTVTSAVAHVTVVPRPIALSARLLVGGDAAVAVFTIEGSVSKQVLLRAVGPGLAPFGLTGLLADPQLEVFNSVGTLITLNDDWGAAPNAAAIASTTAAVGGFALAAGSRDSAILQTFVPGSYTVRASPGSGAGGIAYLELFDTDLVPTASRIPFVAVRGRVSAGDGVMVGGLGSNGRGARSYLLRAVGPALGLPGAYANPSLLAVRDGMLVGMNLDWDAVAADGAATTTATMRVGAFPLPAGSLDAALVLTGNLHAGPHTAQVGGPDGLSGIVLLELHDLDATRPATFPPVIVSPPVPQVVTAGALVTLAARAHGTGPLSYQWLKDGANVVGATTATFTLTSAVPADGGLYTVVVTNTQGSATSIPAALTVQGATGSVAAMHAPTTGGYVAGGTVTIINSLTFTGPATSLGWSVTLPAGWSFASDAGTAGVTKPEVGATGTIAWAWTTPPASPLNFTYTLNVPIDAVGPKNLIANSIVRDGSTIVQTAVATPNPLTLSGVPAYHSADTDIDHAISLFELTRVIELYNTRNGTVRTGAYRVDPTGEDGFAADATRPAGSSVALARHHSADTTGATAKSPRDGAIDLFELTRVIELYNTRAGTVRTGAYHAQAGTEDGFAAGP